MTAGETQRRRGWSVVLGCFIGLFFAASPAYFSSFGVYLKPIAADMGWSRSALSVPVAVTALVAAIFLPLTGVAVDRFGPRRLILVACLALPAVMAGFYFFESYAALLMLAVVMGIVVAPSSPLTYLSLLPQWFDRNLGLAVSVAMCGIGIGAAALPLVAQYAVGEFGWRQAWLIMAALILVAGLLNWVLLIRENPAHVAARQDPAAPGLEGSTLKEALRTVSLWLLLLCFFFVSVAVSGTVIHAVALLTDRGVTPDAAVRFVSLLGMSTIAGRLITGVMLDRLPIAAPGVLFFGLLAVGLILLLIDAGGPSTYIAMVLIGCGFGAEGDIMPYVVRRKFGLKAFGKIYGVCFCAFQFGPVVGPLMMGVSFDRLGGYEPALIANAVLALAGTLLIVVATRGMSGPVADPASPQRG